MSNKDLFDKYYLYKGAWCCKNICKQRELSSNECKALLSRGGYLVRNVFDFDCSENTSFWYVIKDSSCNIQDIPSKYRSYVRKALEKFDIRKISNEEMVTYGYSVYVKASNSYEIESKPVSYDTFKSWYSNSKMDFWGAFDKGTGEMVAYATNTINDNYCEYNALKADPYFMKKYYVYYGLIFEMNHFYLETLGLDFVNDGARSISNHSNIQSFLVQKFKFRYAYCRLKVHYKWWLAIIIRILFPFRKIIKHNKIQSILNLELMVRGEI